MPDIEIKRMIVGYKVLFFYEMAIGYQKSAVGAFDSGNPDNYRRIQTAGA